MSSSNSVCGYDLFTLGGMMVSSSKGYESNGTEAQIDRFEMSVIVSESVVDLVDLVDVELNGSFESVVCSCDNVV